MNSIRALGARLVTMAISLVCGVLTTRLVLGETGVEYYALYTLLVSLPTLLSFTDLGSGAVIVNGIAESDDPRHDRTVVTRLTAVGRILIGFAIVTMIVNAVFFSTGFWRVVLGDAGRLPGADTAAFVCLTVFCLGVPIGIWQRVLLGLGRNHIIILLQGLQSPVTLLCVWGLISLGPDRVHSFLSIGSYFASFLVAVLGLSLTAVLTRPLIPSAIRAIPRLISAPSVKVMDVGWPMLAQLVSYPIAMSAQRYILAQSSGPHEVAQYGVAGQVFFALQGLVTAAGVALWPTYTRARRQGELKRGPFGLSALFGGGVLVATLLVWLAGPWIFGFITNHALDLRGTVILWFGVMISLQGAIYPLGMFIMDKPGIRFQVAPTLLMAVSTVGLSVLLSPMLGAEGPPIANVASVILFQLIPFTLYIRRHSDRLMARR